MASARRRWADEMLHFWFHTLSARQWFARSDAVDDVLRRRFARELKWLAGQQPRSFLHDRHTARAAVLLFDQLPRNLHRDSARAFATDALARAVCKGAIAHGWDKRLAKSERQFLYMPLMHSEAIADQRLSLQLFTALDDSSIRRFARSHYRMVARFGRFPHRNAELGRISTPAELGAIAAGNSW